MSTTARDLRERLIRLVALGLATTFVAFGAFRAVHDDAARLAGSSSPGVLAVDTARSALMSARESVPGAGLDGAGSGTFHTRVSVAHQALAVAASENVTGVEGRRTIQTVTGLIAVYSGWVEQAHREPARSPLRAAYLHYADRVLNAPGTEEDITGRLTDLRSQQVAVAKEQASLGWARALSWTAAALFALLCAALWETQRFTRHRFRRLADPPLLAAAALWTAGAAVLAWLTLRTRGGTARALAELRTPRTGDGVAAAGGRVAEHLAGVDLRAAASDLILVGGVALVALTVSGLLPRINEYRQEGRR
ncbi:hypothetical protein M4914_12525 [Streptomyces somaliensis DSM 40738]|uniref:Uncharacterized protein n=1 Tax=Streptomyces somaliensis (strain ATCC 33201 / DSM 40738 / JCM 12659 / KCTC 9044 / NCTC 11332 / NRRL B-12077 / IP 733) TaxID=1134445 RepID=A0AA44DAE4_STRE0|nr:hypothetical protein [Streptomyces somaliensis]MCQ0023692.1 hypothetical protein [Streptomyces somaliensis DSM 40738]NKY13112.1 hypothetical protein [Streptomyces somaliensis DSM 40738]